MKMREFTVEAIVLGLEEVGEYDRRFFLYTRDFGKVVARATSIRKITSKLAGHMETGNLVIVRLANKSESDRYQLTDALRVSRPSLFTGTFGTLFSILELFQRASPEGIPDQELWQWLLDLINAGSTENLNFHKAL